MLGLDLYEIFRFSSNVIVAPCLVQIQSSVGETRETTPEHSPWQWYMEAVRYSDNMNGPSWPYRQTTKMALNLATAWLQELPESCQYLFISNNGRRRATGAS